MTTPDVTKFLEAVRKDRHSQNQYEPISADEGYLCEFGCEATPATWKRTAGPVAYSCDPCRRDFPPTLE